MIKVTPKFLLPHWSGLHLIAITRKHPPAAPQACRHSGLHVHPPRIVQRACRGSRKERCRCRTSCGRADSSSPCSTVASISRSSSPLGARDFTSHTAEQQLVVQHAMLRAVPGPVAAGSPRHRWATTTAIIALSGCGASGIPDVDEAIDLVNSWPATAWPTHETRFASLRSSPASSTTSDRRGDRPALGSRRRRAAAGIGWGTTATAVQRPASRGLTETGRRPSNTAVGRALPGLSTSRRHRGSHQRHHAHARHAEGAARVVVSWTTGSSTGTMSMTDRPAYRRSSQDSLEPSTGRRLTNLASVIQAAGGALESAPASLGSSGGCCVPSSRCCVLFTGGEHDTCLLSLPHSWGVHC